MNRKNKPNYSQNENNHSAITSQPSSKSKNNSNRTNTTKEPPNKEKEKAFLNWCKKNKSIIETAIAAITIIAYMIVSCDQSKKTKDAINMADTANFYTRQSLDFTRETSQKELRAYLDIDSFEGININPTNPIEFNPIIRNTGKTPANSIKVWNYITIDIEHFNQDTINHLITTQQPISGIPFIGAEKNQKMGIKGLDIYWWIVNYPKIIRGEVDLHFIIYIGYKDIFNIYHFTQLHFRYSPENGRMIYEPTYIKAE